MNSSLEGNTNRVPTAFLYILGIQLKTKISNNNKFFSLRGPGQKIMTNTLAKV